MLSWARNTRVMSMLTLERGETDLATLMMRLRPPSPDHVSGILGWFCSSFPCIEEREIESQFDSCLIACLRT